MIIFALFFFNDTATTEIYTLSLHDALPISRRRGLGLGEKDRRLRDFPACRAEGFELPEPDALHRPAPAEQAPDGRGGGGGEGEAEDGEPPHGAGEAREHVIELGVLARLPELPRQRLLDVAVGARGELHPVRRTLV